MGKGRNKNQDQDQILDFPRAVENLLQSVADDSVFEILGVVKSLFPEEKNGFLVVRGRLVCQSLGVL